MVDDSRARDVPGNRFAVAVIEARRDRGLDLAGLARLADLPVAEVADVEAGVPAAPAARTALTRVLGLDAGAAALVRPRSAAHAAAMLAVAREAAAVGGVAVMADLADWDASEEGRAREAFERLDHLGTTVALGAVALVALLAGVELEFAHASLARDLGELAAWLVPPMPLLTSVLAFRSFVGRIGRWSDARSELERVRLAAALHGRAAATGHVVSRDGVRAVDAGRAGAPTVTLHPAETVYAAEVRDVGGGLVDVVVRTTGGDVAMTSVPRSQELVDALRALTERSGAPWDPTFVEA